MIKLTRISINTVQKTPNPHVYLETAITSASFVDLSKLCAVRIIRLRVQGALEKQRAWERYALVFCIFTYVSRNKNRNLYAYLYKIVRSDTQVQIESMRGVHY